MGSPEPAVKRAVAFVDGQNLFWAVKDLWGYSYPNYDVLALVNSVTTRKGWRLAAARFYTGVPSEADDFFWSRFWAAKLLSMSRQGVRVFSRTLRYRDRDVLLPGGTVQRVRVGQEKGIDVRLALDVVRMAHRGEFDVAVVFSQDQDLSEVASEIRTIAREQRRWLKIASAYPWSPLATNARGIYKTDWISIERTEYDACLDPHDYRPKAGRAIGPTP